MIKFRYWSALLPVTLLLACSRQPSASPAARFAATPPTIDGQATDWSDSLRYDPASKLQYQVLNDGRSVYVRLKAADPATQAKIVRWGLTVWLDTTGRNQHQFGVHYPLGSQGTGRGPGNPDATPPDQPDNADGTATDRQAGRRARLSQVLANMREMELLNYKGSKETTLTDAQSPLGVKAALGFDAQEDLVYELAVPMRLLYRHLPGLSSGKVAVVGLTVAGSNPAASSVASPDGSVMNGGRGNMGMRGGMPGGSAGMRGGYGAENISLKTSAQLSAK